MDTSENRGGIRRWTHLIRVLSGTVSTRFHRDLERNLAHHEGGCVDRGRQSAVSDLFETRRVAVIAQQFQLTAQRLGSQCCAHDHIVVGREHCVDIRVGLKKVHRRGIATFVGQAAMGG